MEQWTAEVLGVAGTPGMDRPITVGHSMGRFVTMVTAAIHGDDIAGTTIIDSPVRRPDPETEEANRGRAFSNLKTYPSLEEAMEHFHLVPPQPCENRYFVDHIAQHSLRQTPAGWTWKFDRGVFDRFAAHELHELHGQFQRHRHPRPHLGDLDEGSGAPQHLGHVSALLADCERSVPVRR